MPDRRAPASQPEKSPAAPNGGYVRASPWTAVTRSNPAVRHRAARHGMAAPGQIQLTVVRLSQYSSEVQQRGRRSPPRAAPKR